MLEIKKLTKEEIKEHFRKLNPDCIIEFNSYEATIENKRKYVYTETIKEIIDLVEYIHIRNEIEKYISEGKCFFNEVSFQNSSDYDGGELRINFRDTGYSYCTNKTVYFNDDGYLVIKNLQSCIN